MIVIPQSHPEAKQPHPQKQSKIDLKSNVMVKHLPASLLPFLFEALIKCADFENCGAATAGIPDKGNDRLLHFSRFLRSLWCPVEFGRLQP